VVLRIGKRVVMELSTDGRIVINDDKRKSTQVDLNG